MHTRQRETFRIGGMHGTHCTNAVREALKRLEGLDLIDVQVGSVTVAYDPERTPRRGILDAIEGAGYENEPQRQT